MTTSWQHETTVVKRLRVSGPGLDPTLTQLRITNTLNMVDLHPRGLAPAAIVCIRTLRDPLPGVLQLQQGGLPPPRVWEHAVVASLEQLVRDAAYPIRGMVPANANAVIFADQAELLACLASDWCQEHVLMRWWWQSLFKGIDLTRSILPAWLEAPAYAPAALQYLAERREAVPFVRALSVGDAHTLLQSITHSFALYKLQAVLNEKPDEHRRGMRTTLLDSPSVKQQMAEAELHPHEVSSLAGGTSPTALTMGENRLLTPAAAPWQQHVPEGTDTGLHAAQQLLLGIGLMLRRAPMRVRTEAFLQEVRRWLVSSSPPVQHSPPIIRTERSAVGEESHTSVAPMPGPAVDAHVALPGEQQQAGEIYLEEPVAEAVQPFFAPEHVSLPLSGRAIERSAAPIGDDSAVSSPALVSELSDEVSLQAVSVDTAYAGIFYLLNVGIALDLYSDFTNPKDTGIPLAVWDFLTLLGYALMGEPLRLDPVWLLLAQLAGRNEQDELGKDFVPPDSWHVPGAWLTAFTGADVRQAWQWLAEDGRLRLQHPAQFCVLDVPLDSGDPVEQLAREVQIYQDVVGELHRLERLSNTVSTHQMPGLPAHLERWLDWLMPYLCARLCRALGLTEVHMLAHMLCKHTARILVTSTHLDIFLSLNELPIEIRMAGLDRDPGWIPAAGRFVAFHFD